MSTNVTVFPFGKSPLLLSIGLFLTLFLSACNLGTASNSAPPTLAPRATATPPATLGVSGNVDNIGSQFVPGNITTPIADPDLEVFALLNQVEQDRLMAHIDTLENFYTRHVNSVSSSNTRGIGAARAYIEAQFRDIQQASNGRLYTFPQEFTANYNNIPTRQQNIVAVIQGTEAGAGTLVIGAHYDSIGAPDFNDAGAFAPGANDNGSGVAAIIELARILSQKQHRATIMLVAFSAEEVNRQGSKAFVEYLLSQNIDILGMINVDTIGNHHNFSGAVSGDELRVFSVGPNDTSTSRHMARTAEFISFTHGLPMKLIVEDQIDREGRYGDHFSFSEVGYPAIRFINAFEEKTNGDPTDTIEFVEPEYLRKAVQSLLVVTTSIADGARPPRNVTLRDRGNGVDTLVWEPIPDATGYVIALRWPNSVRYDQQIEVTGNSIDWDGFSNYAGIAISVKDANGIVGPLSSEYRIE